MYSFTNFEQKKYNSGKTSSHIYAVNQLLFFNTNFVMITTSVGKNYLDPLIFHFQMGLTK